MAATRSSQNSPPPPASSGTKKQNNKRSAEPASSPPSAKRGKGTSDKKGKEKEQKTIEETLGVVEGAGDGIESDGEVEMQINGGKEDEVNQGVEEKAEIEDEDEKSGDQKKQEKKNCGDVAEKKTEKKNEPNNDAKDKRSGTTEGQNGKKNAFDEVKADESEVKAAAEQEQDEKAAKINKNNESIIEDSTRESQIPSSILEKGIIYFFFRGRVGVEDPQGIEDVARSYIILRPIPVGAKLGEGPLEDSGDARMLALPKKMLPKSKSDRFLMFVEKGKASIKEVRDQFAHNDYSTKTSGTSHTPAATPFAEGIYAITTTGRESHLAYHITVPSPIGEIQKELGLNEKGSYVVSVKNPEAPGPANATIDNPAKYPESIQKKFRGLRWMPLEPELLNYEGTQFLIIGEGLGDVENATEELSKDKKDDEKEKPGEELEKLEEEDHDRVEHLKEDDPVFADLGLSSKEYSKMQTTW